MQSVAILRPFLTGYLLAINPSCVSSYLGSIECDLIRGAHNRILCKYVIKNMRKSYRVIRKLSYRQVKAASKNKNCPFQNHLGKASKRNRTSLGFCLNLH